mmetsp:Transcript_22682/g.44515  ORF Transcript_22682/g.44515 Transcript_22682/m.44515 type:complete len:88 (-) Transcript_22682:148-411(-)
MPAGLLLQPQGIKSAVLHVQHAHLQHVSEFSLSEKGSSPLIILFVLAIYRELSPSAGEASQVSAHSSSCLEYMAMSKLRNLSSKSGS